MDEFRLTEVQWYGEFFDSGGESRGFKEIIPPAPFRKGGQPGFPLSRE
jgi:hypothetical protein